MNKVQYNEYYPFGMSTANSWTRENTMGNNFLGNGGTELNQTSQLYDLDYRNYDPILGRMNGIDPMATKYASLSPYNFSFNDPVTFNDVSGADPYQRSDDTWWVANRQSLHGGRYTGFSSLNDFLRENRSSGVFGNTDPWAWTGMSSGEIYGGGFGMAGTIGYNYGFGTSNPLSQFISTALNSEHGGTWSNGQGRFFKSDREALFTGMAYNYNHNSWANTQWGSGSATLAYYETSQSLLNPDYGSMCACLDYQDAVVHDGEYALTSRFTKRDNGTGVAHLVFEFFSGLGPEYSLFEGDHPMVEALKDSYIIAFARVLFVIGGSEAMFMEDIPFGLIGLPLSGTSPTEQFIGGARVSLIPTAYGHLYIVNNTTDQHSAKVHLGKSYPRNPNGITPGGNIYQRFIWLEKNK